MSNDAVQPTRDEEAYFKKIAEEQKARLKAQMAEQQRAESDRELKELHWMRCAKCGHEMTTVVFRGVSIERCFRCGGVYLDDGELEKLAGSDRSGLVRTLGSLFRSKDEA